MKEQTVLVNVKDGMDAHGVALCVQTASKFDSTIKLTDGVRRMNAKSIMGMMALGLALGDSVTIQIEGSDEDQAMEEMARFFEGK